MVWLASLVTILHIIACVILILVILLQHGGKADLGVFGGSSTQTAFGGAGPASGLQKITAAAAAIFMITCLILSIYSGRPAGEKSGVLEKIPNNPPPVPKPAAPPPGQPTPGQPQGTAPAQPQGGAPQEQPGAAPTQSGPAPTPAPQEKKNQ